MGRMENTMETIIEEFPIDERTILELSVWVLPVNLTVFLVSRRGSITFFDRSGATATLEKGH